MKKVIIGLAVAMMAMVAGGCGTATGTGSEIGLNLQQQQTESGAGTGSVRIKVSLYDQDATVLAAPKRAGGVMRVQDIMKGMTKKFFVYLYEVDDTGNFVNGGIDYSSSADVVDGSAEIIISTVSSGRRYYVAVYGKDESGLHDLFIGWQSGVSVSADVATAIEVRMEMAKVYWIDLSLFNISGSYYVGESYTGTIEGLNMFGSYSYTTSCISVGQGKISCPVGVPTEETSSFDFRITDTNGIEHTYRFRVGIRDAFDDGKIEVNLASGSFALGISFSLDVDQIYIDGLSGETNYVWYTTYGGLPIGIVAGDTLEFTYDDGGVTKSIATAVVTAYADGSGFYCKIIWSQLPQSWWDKRYYTVKVVTPPVPVV